MAKRSHRRNVFYQNMLSESHSAIEYWAEMETVIETEGVILAFELIELGDDDKPLANLGTVDIETIAKGWQALLAKETEGGFCHCGRERNSVREAEKALKEQSNGEEYDACVIDAVIQMAMFGELKYG